LAYSDEAKKYLDAVTAIHERAANSTRGDHQQLQKTAEELRQATERARVAMELHILSHRC